MLLKDLRRNSFAYTFHNPIFNHFILIIILILFIEKDKKIMIKKIIMMKKQVK